MRGIQEVFLQKDWVKEQLDWNYILWDKKEPIQKFVVNTGTGQTILYAYACIIRGLEL